MHACPCARAVCVCVCGTYVHIAHVWRLEDNLGAEAPPSTIQVLGIRLRLDHVCRLAGGTFGHTAVLPTPLLAFNVVSVLHVTPAIPTLSL